MKWLIVSFAALLLTACSTPPPPSSMLDSDWKTYGYDRAMLGWVIQSESKLVKLSDGKAVNESNYEAYTSGYNAGQEKYCQQSAYMLGVIGKPYNGICDKVDPFFRQDYIDGKHSTAGGM